MFFVGHHRDHSLKKNLKYKILLYPYIYYNSSEINVYFFDRMLKDEIIHNVNSGRLLPPKSSKHVIRDKEKINISQSYFYLLCGILFLNQ